MRNLKVSILFFLIVGITISLIVGCQKNTNLDKPVFVQKIFYAQGEADAKARVNSFLDAVTQQELGISDRDPFPDTEVNQGRWTLTAAFNYENNADLLSDGEVEYQSYTVTISNTVDNGELKMIGTEMVNKYQEFKTIVANDEQAKSSTAVASEFKLGNVTNDFTDIDITIIYKDLNVPPVSGWHQTWIDAGLDINAELTFDVSPNGCFPWVPDLVLVYYNDENTTYPQCSPLMLNVCFSCDEAVNMDPAEYDLANFDLDLMVASDFGEYYIGIYNANRQIVNSTNGLVEFMPSVSLRTVQVGTVVSARELSPTEYINSVCIIVYAVWGAPQVFCG